MSRRSALRAVLAAVLCLSGLAGAGEGPPAYAAKVRFDRDRPLAFPDFTLTYLGARRVASDRYPRGFVVHDFRISWGEQSRQVAWSAGTGDLGPTRFEAAGRRFDLELARSDRLGRLEADELVVTPVAGDD